MIFKLSASRVINWVPTLLPGCNPLTTHHRILTFWGSWVHIYKTFTRDYSRERGQPKSYIILITPHLTSSEAQDLLNRLFVPGQVFCCQICGNEVFPASETYMNQTNPHVCWFNYWVVWSYFSQLILFSLFFNTSTFLFWQNTSTNMSYRFLFLCYFLSVNQTNEPNKKWVAYGNLPRRKLLPPPKSGRPSARWCSTFPTTRGWTPATTTRQLTGHATRVGDLGGNGVPWFKSDKLTKKTWLVSE